MHYGVRFMVTLLVAISVFASRKDLPRKILVCDRMPEAQLQ